MIKRRRFKFNFWSGVSCCRFRGLSFYWHGGIWRDILHHVGALSMPAIALEVTLLWVLGLLAGSFALLQIDQQLLRLPSFSLSLSYGVAQLLLPVSQESGASLARIWIVFILAIAWLCMVAAISQTARLVSRVYRSSVPKRPRWVTLIYHWFLTLLLLTVASLALHWLGPDTISPETATDLRLKTAEGSRVAAPWQTTLWGLIRWPATLAILALALGTFYRLSPQRWQRGAPLWSGVGLSLLLGSLGIGLSRWMMNQITAQALAYGSLLQLALVLVTMLGLALLIPLGAQFNVSLVNLNQVSMPLVQSPRLSAPPPSFESFKINRGPGDHFRGE